MRGRNRIRRNWEDLPSDVMASILSRLGVIEILKNAQFVCKTWYQICKGPLTWRTIDMRNDGSFTPIFDMRNDGSFTTTLNMRRNGSFRTNFERACRLAISRSSGKFVDINLEYFCTNALLKHIAESSSEIRRLRLAFCFKISDDVLSEVATKLALLEDLEITLCKLSHQPLEVVGKSCPGLRSFKLNQIWAKKRNHRRRRSGPQLRSFQLNKRWAKYGYHRENDNAIAIAGTMQGLRHLQLLGDRLTNDGLCAILDCCSQLESLDLRNCLNLNLDGDLGKRCAERIKKLKLPTDLVGGNESRSPTNWGVLYDCDSDYVEFLMKYPECLGI